MKLLAAWMLLVSLACADARWRPPILPYQKQFHLPWSKIPYPNCPFKITLSDGIEYEISNPQGWACEPEYNWRHYFQVFATVHRDQITIEEAEYEGSVEAP